MSSDVTLEMAAMLARKRSRSFLKAKLDVVEQKQAAEEENEAADKDPTENGDEEDNDVFMSENLPTYAKSYILPRRMRRNSSLAMEQVRLADLLLVLSV